MHTLINFGLIFKENLLLKKNNTSFLIGESRVANNIRFVGLPNIKRWKLSIFYLYGQRRLVKSTKPQNGYFQNKNYILPQLETMTFPKIPYHEKYFLAAISRNAWSTTWKTGQYDEKFSAQISSASPKLLSVKNFSVPTLVNHSNYLYSNNIYLNKHS